MEEREKIVSSTRRMIAYAYGTILILIGLDKALHLDIIVNWEKYVSPLAHSVIPLTTPVFLTVLGVAEIIVGILFFTKWVRLAALIAIVVLALIIVNLLDLGYGFYDIAARDFLIALGGISVIRLSFLEGYTFSGKTA